MLIVAGLTVALSCAGLFAPPRVEPAPGTRPPSFVAPGTPIPGLHKLSADASSALMIGSLTASGTVVNGMFFGITATLEPVGCIGTIWPPALIAGVVAVTFALILRGGYRLARQRPNAARDLRRGWYLGMGATLAALAGLWAWPTLLTAKLAFSGFMLPMSAAAICGGLRALRKLKGLPSP